MVLNARDNAMPMDVLAFNEWSKKRNAIGAQLVVDEYAAIENFCHAFMWKPGLAQSLRTSDVCMTAKPRSGVD